MKFELNYRQIDKLFQWNKEQNEIAAKKQGSSIPYYGAIGGHLKYEFTPTSIGVFVHVKHAGTDAEIDLTDYENF